MQKHPLTHTQKTKWMFVSVFCRHIKAKNQGKQNQNITEEEKRQQGSKDVGKVIQVPEQKDKGADTGT